jgi:hypothetical protein
MRENIFYKPDNLMNVVEGLKGFARAPRNILAALHVSFMV